MTAYLWGFAGVLAGVVLPGLAIAALCDRRAPVERVTPERFAAIALASGLSTWVLVGRALDRLGLLTRGSTLIVMILIAATSVAVIVGPGRSTLRALAQRDTASFAGWAFGSTLLGAAPLLRIVIDNRDALIGSTPWYYWSLVRQTVIASGTPATSREWGTRVPFLDDYPGFTPAVAVLALPGRAASLAAAHIVEVLVMLSAGLAVFLLVRALSGSRVGAAIATLLFFAADVFGNKLLALRPEAMGYAFAMLTPVLALEYFRTRDRRVLAVLGATFAALGLVHGIDWLFGTTLLAGAVIAAFPSRADARQWWAGAVTVALVSLGAWVVSGLVLDGNLSGASSLGDLPVVENGIDPTWRFAALVQGSSSLDPPSVGRLIETSLDRGLRGLGSPWFIGLAVAMVAILLVRAFVIPGARDRTVARRALSFLAVAGGLTVVAAAIFGLGWTTYVPRRTGVLRLVQIALLLVPVAAGVALSGLTHGASRRAERVILVAAGAALVFVAFVYAHGQSRLDLVAEQRPSRATLGPLRALRLAPEDAVLTNGYSEGSVPVISGGRGVLEGRAPYTDARLLRRANELLTRAQHFLASPLAADADLPCSGIRYVLVSTDGGRVLGMQQAFGTDFAGLDARPDLEPVSSGPGFRLYRVLPTTTGRAPPLDCGAVT